jgi:hypothetical protein
MVLFVKKLSMGTPKPLTAHANLEYDRIRVLPVPILDFSTSINARLSAINTWDVR